MRKTLLALGTGLLLASLGAQAQAQAQIQATAPDGRPAATRPAGVVEWRLAGAHDFESKQPGFGNSRRYASALGWVDVYRYSLNRSDWAPGIDDAGVAAELDGVLAGLRVVQAQGTVSELSLTTPAHVLSIAGQPFRSLSLHFALRGQASDSAAYVTVRDGQLLKYRITVKAGSEPAVEALAEDFIARDLAGALAP